jgi:hypothetical protein
MALVVTRTKAETLLVAGPQAEPVRTLLTWFGGGDSPACTCALLWALPDYINGMVARLRLIVRRFRYWASSRTSHDTGRALDALDAYCDAHDSMRAAEGLMLGLALAADNQAVYSTERPHYDNLTSGGLSVVRAWEHWLAVLEEETNQVMVVVRLVRAEHQAPAAAEADEPRKRVRHAEPASETEPSAAQPAADEL